MNFNNDEVPIYIQIAKNLEDAIFQGIYEEESQIPSTTEISVNYKINPATVLKGMNILVNEEIIYKKRGVGMFVLEGAQERIKEKRKTNFYESFVKPLISEAKKLGLTKAEIEKIVEEEFIDETQN